MLQIHRFQLRERMFGDYDYDDENEMNIIDGNKKKKNSPVHPDLLIGLEAFKPHIAVLMGWQTAILKPDAGNLDPIVPFAIDFGTGNDVVIKFKYKLPGVGYQTTITLPKIDFTLDEENYKFMKKLKDCTTKFLAKVEAYHNGEYGDGAQMAMEFQNKDAKNAGNDSDEKKIGVNVNGKMVSEV